MFSLSRLASIRCIALRTCACALLTISSWNASAQDEHGQVLAQTSSPADSTLYLTLQQAISMALKNNLDIQLEQLDQNVAGFSLQRTKGGGTPRTSTTTSLKRLSVKERALCHFLA